MCLTVFPYIIFFCKGTTEKNQLTPKSTTNCIQAKSDMLYFKKGFKVYFVSI